MSFDTTNNQQTNHGNPLGKTTDYVSHYDPELLFPIAREEKRSELPQEYLQFVGEDIWNAYEVSWLNPKGKPEVAIGEFRLPANSPNIIESKSLKLYLNSLNQAQFSDMKTVEDTLRLDLSAAAGAEFRVKLQAVSESRSLVFKQFSGILLDLLDVEISDYDYSPQLLSTDKQHPEVVKGQLVSHLLKSNCLITNQPDWASIYIHYEGIKITHESLLKYFISFRSHNEFHEQCVERIFSDIKQYCAPEKLTVYARYTRRGGLDINPWRSDFEDSIENIRLLRQ